MAEDKPPSRAPWLDEIKRTGQLTIAFDGSIGRALWDRVFRDAIFEFNKLSNTHRLGITFVRSEDAAKANVEARAASGDFEFQFPPDIPKRTIRFDGKSVHGLCKPVLTLVTDRSSRVNQFKLMKAFIYVPANPTGDARPVGDPVKLVIAVHELIHACGLVDDKEHSVDDIFSWPQLRIGNQASEDRLATLGGTITFPGKPGEPPRTGHSTVDMPPLFLKNQTIEKIRNLWS
jgi:hypothetical protein